MACRPSVNFLEWTSIVIFMAGGQDSRCDLHTVLILKYPDGFEPPITEGKQLLIL